MPALSGCAPGTPDGDSWRIDAQRAVSEASSAVLTAELALRQNDHRRVFDHSPQPVLGRPEKAVSKAGGTIGSEQPPRAERERSDTVTGQIDQAAGLVTTARIAAGDHESDRYPGLADRLAAAAAALQKLEDDLQHPPRTGG